MHNVFSRSPKKVAQLKVFQAFNGTACLRILRVCDTRWMSVGNCYSTVGKEYLALLDYMKSEPDNREVYLLLRDVHVVLGMRVFTAMLLELNVLTQMCQRANVHHDQLAAAIDRTCDNLTSEYISGSKMFRNQIWKDYIAVGTDASPLSFGGNGTLYYDKKHAL